MPSWKVLEGDVREQLAALPDDSVHCVMTSPPYWGLRDYGTGTWEGGDADCDHIRRKIVLNQDFNERWGQGGGQKKQEHRTDPYRDECGKCGATRVDRQVGLEASPAAYVESLVKVFREVRRVLRPDGTCWLNMGDSYASDPAKGYGGVDGKNPKAGSQRARYAGPDLKPKDLVGIPWTVALALRDDGWWLRSDIVWAKPNPMPESVTDRPTRAHEFIFLLTKSERYFYDAYAVREPSTPDMRRRAAAGHTRGGTGESRDASRNDRDSLAGQRQITADGRNKRDVWTIATRPFPEAHFAVFPPELVEPCVKAGSSEHGCCADCGAPYRRRVEKVRAPDSKAGKNFMRGAGHQRERDGGPANREGREYEAVVESRTTGWDPTCECGADVVPCVVLDPFAGSGTTLLVTNRLGRDAVGVELSPEYAAMIRRRLRGDMPLFAVEAE